MVFNWLKTEWENNKFLFFNEILCIFTGLSSAIYMTLAVPNINFKILYIIYTIDSISCTITAIYKKSFGLLINSCIYLIIDTIGMFKIFIK